MSIMQIEILRSGDNYIYLICDGKSAAVVDPSESGNVLMYVRKAGLDLNTILITHNHHDHTVLDGEPDTGAAPDGAGLHCRCQGTLERAERNRHREQGDAGGVEASA